MMWVFDSCVGGSGSVGGARLEDSSDEAEERCFSRFMSIKDQNYDRSR